MSMLWQVFSPGGTRRQSPEEMEEGNRLSSTPMKAQQDGQEVEDDDEDEVTFKVNGHHVPPTVNQFCKYHYNDVWAVL